MSGVTAVAVYFIIWWTVLFTVLPFGVRPQEDPVPGSVPSAPARPRLLLKFLCTTAIAAAVWGVVDALVLSGVISFRDWAQANFG